jgi:hypothetical protein
MAEWRTMPRRSSIIETARELAIGAADQMHDVGIELHAIDL